MIRLNFKGPFTLAEVLKIDVQYAVYIWGFSHPENRKFIPYYVGEVCGTKLGVRFKNREKEIKKEESTYLRLSDGYLFGTAIKTAFFKDSKFPPNNDIEFPTGGRLFGKWWNNNRDIIYINSWTWGSMQNPPIKKVPKKQLSLDVYKGSLKGAFNDSLNPRYKYMEIYYAEINKEQIDELKSNTFFSQSVIADSIIVQMCEAYTKYALKGKTVSRANYFSDNSGKITNPFNNMMGINKELIRLMKYIKITNNPCGIFDQKSGVVTPSCNFSGY